MSKHMISLENALLCNLERVVHGFGNFLSLVYSACVAAASVKLFFLISIKLVQGGNSFKIRICIRTKEIQNRQIE